METQTKITILPHATLLVLSHKELKQEFVRIEGTYNLASCRVSQRLSICKNLEMAMPRSSALA